MSKSVIRRTSEPATAFDRPAAVVNKAEEVYDARGNRLYGMDAELELKLRQKRDPKHETRALQWVAAITGEDGVDTVHAGLKSGLVLCKLINTFFPDIISEKKMHFKSHPLHERENVQLYVAACERIGIDRGDLFNVNDLYEEKDLPAVVRNIYAFGAMVADKRDMKHLPKLKMLQRSTSMITLPTKQSNAARLLGAAHAAPGGSHRVRSPHATGQGSSGSPAQHRRGKSESAARSIHVRDKNLQSSRPLTPAKKRATSDLETAARRVPSISVFSSVSKREHGKPDSGEITPERPLNTLKVSQGDQVSPSRSMSSVATRLQAPSELPVGADTAGTRILLTSGATLLVLALWFRTSPFIAPADAADLVIAALLCSATQFGLGLLYLPYSGNGGNKRAAILFVMMAAATIGDATLFDPLLGISTLGVGMADSLRLLVCGLCWTCGLLGMGLTIFTEVKGGSLRK